MTQVNITLSHEEVLQVLSGDRDDAFKFLIERILNAVMLAESEQQLGASMHERTQERLDYRNGTRERILHTRIGSLTLEVPRHRSQPFHTMVFENYQRSEASLIATMVQMVIAGVSTRKVSKVVETLCGTSFSKSTVSTLCKQLDDEITAFKNRPLNMNDAPFLMVDATYFKAREDHKIVSKAFLVALAISSDGCREIVGFDVFDTEDNYSWQEFFKDLKRRGLTGVHMVVSDAHKSILHAIAKTYPDAAWQRCQVHYMRNILNETPTRFKEGLKTELRNMFNASSIEDARAIRDDIIRDYEPVVAKAIRVLDEGFEDAMTVMQLPGFMRMNLRSSNWIERLNREFKRRSDVIQIFPNAASILRLMGAVAIEYNDQLSMKKRFFAEKTFNQIKIKLIPKLKEIASTQQALLDAA
ncbi:MAG: IS256 family transposase [Firmicutes bacterium]|nr:IS256 family transposase [Bacillota bacterium]